MTWNGYSSPRVSRVMWRPLDGRQRCRIGATQPLRPRRCQPRRRIARHPSSQRSQRRHHCPHRRCSLRSTADHHHLRHRARASTFASRIQSTPSGSCCSQSIPASNAGRRWYCPTASCARAQPSTARPHASSPRPPAAPPTQRRARPAHRAPWCATRESTSTSSERGSAAEPSWATTHARTAPTHTDHRPIPQPRAATLHVHWL